MRHHVAHRKLGRVTEHRLSLLRNQAQALIRHERIQTTIPKAKELRPFVERLISIAKRAQVAGDGHGGRLLHARRLVLRDLPDQEVVKKLFDAIAPRFAQRPGGYTRLLRLGYRKGDSAEVAQVELVGSEFNPKTAEKDTKAAGEAAKKQGVGGRLRAAAQRIRGRRAAGEEPRAEKESAERKPARSPRAAKAKKTEE